MGKIKTSLVIALIFAFATIGAGCFFLGKSIAMADYSSERDLDIIYCGDY